MKKHAVTKLFLAKETLRHLKAGDLRQAEGGLEAVYEPNLPVYSQQDSVRICCA